MRLGFWARSSAKFVVTGWVTNIPMDEIEDRKKKIILFIDSLVSGGAQRQLVTLACELSKKKYPVCVLTYRNETQLLWMLNKRGIRYHVVEKKSKLDLRFFFRLVVFFRHEQPDCIISYLNTPNFWARIAGRIARVPTIITSERNIDINRSSVRVNLERILYRLSTKIVVNANAIQELLVEVGLPIEKIKVIQNGLDTVYFQRRSEIRRQEFRRNIGVGDGETLITLVGRMQQQKNHVGLLRAFASLGHLNSSIKIMFVGNEIEPAIKQKLKDLCSASDMEHQVIFAGAKDNLPLIYTASDFTILPSLWEGFPNALIESMACETPVIATDIADNRLIISDESMGYIVPRENETALANTILSASRMTIAERQKMGRESREKIIKMCGLDRFVTRYEELIEA
ncbi:MAG: glycosyltransferase involved in cell wall biosynthesis [Gammaproteobacteria bacterium]|jgi:glycosyltransferase involved in cell wall biosynthesis